MKEIINHSTYGQIVYDESIWTGKKTLTVNGVPAQPVSKKEFIVNGEKATIKGNIYMGLSICIGEEEIELSPKTKWYEIALAVIPLVFLLTWGNSPALCAIFPVVGGALGGAIGGLASIMSLLFMKKTNKTLIKVLIGVGAIAITILAAFLLALLIIMALV